MPRKKRRQTTTAKRVGLRLMELRELVPETLVELAARANVTPEQWRNWENGTSGFPDDQKEKVAEVLGCEVADFFESLGTPLRNNRMLGQIDLWQFKFRDRED